MTVVLLVAKVLYARFFGYSYNLFKVNVTASQFGYLITGFAEGYFKILKVKYFNLALK